MTRNMGIERRSDHREYASMDEPITPTRRRSRPMPDDGVNRKNELDGTRAVGGHRTQGSFVNVL